MTHRETFVAAGFAVLLAGLGVPAMAQAPAPGVAEQPVTVPAVPDVSTLREADDDSMMVPPYNLNVDQVEDMNVVDDAGMKIGEVEEVLVDATGQPVALALEFIRSFGLGDREVVVPLGQVRMLGNDFAISLTKEQLEALPVWDD